jgi:hypothetical protein
MPTSVHWTDVNAFKSTINYKPPPSWAVFETQNLNVTEVLFKKQYDKTVYSMNCVLYFKARAQICDYYLRHICPSIRLAFRVKQICSTGWIFIEFEVS